MHNSVEKQTQLLLLLKNGVACLLVCLPSSLQTYSTAKSRFLTMLASKSRFDLTDPTFVKCSLMSNSFLQKSHNFGVTFGFGKCECIHAINVLSFHIDPSIQ
mmetsp:Transcript_21634/g.35770  ORF Transcript_21634/g.35770 Transcript_21634/m.35770 type:complete len:102 (+) Transcript_21634:12-317(+)